MAVPIGTMHAGAPADLKAVAALVEEHAATLVVVGLPLSMSGETGIGAVKAESFAGGAPLDPGRPGRAAGRASLHRGGRARVARRGRDRARAAKGGRPDGRDRHPAGLAGRDALTATGPRRERAGYPASSWSRDNLAGRTGTTIRAAAPGEVALLALLVVFLLLVGGVIAAGATTTDSAREPAARSSDVAFTVEPGTTGEEVVSQLHDLGVMRCGGSWDVLLRGTGKADAIRAGSYTLTTNMTFDEALLVLSTPPPPVPDGSAHDPGGLPADADRGARARSARHPAGPVPDGGPEHATASLDPYLPEPARGRRASCSPRRIGS